MSRTRNYLRLLARCAWVYILAWTGWLRWTKRRLRDSGAIVTLTFHRVLDDSSYRTTNSLPGMVIRERTFRELVRYLAEWYEPVALADAAPGAPGGTVRLAFTFDDGWRDNYTTAFPILSAYRVPATIFVCPGALGKTTPFWPEQASALLRATPFKRDPGQLEKTVEWLKCQSREWREKYLAELRERGGGYSFPLEPTVDATLSWDEIVEMDNAGICFGSHTDTHQILTTIPTSLAREELVHSKALLERAFNKPCRVFAYPNGDWSPETQQMVREAGFTRAFTTQRGLWTSTSDLLAIPRSNVCESHLVGITGRFWPAMFEYTTLWRAWRATTAHGSQPLPGHSSPLRQGADSNRNSRTCFSQKHPDSHVAGFEHHQVAGGASSAGRSLQGLFRNRMGVALLAAGFTLAAMLSLSAAQNASAPSRNEPIIADHKAVLEFDHIPSQWLEAAKKLTLYFGGASHGSQPVYGALALEQVNPAYRIIVGQWELPEAAAVPALRVNYYTLEANDYWSTPEGLDQTRAAARSGLYSHSLFSWCGEMGSNSKATVQQYLDTLNSLESEFPNMRFIYMTGHADYVDRWTGSELARNNRMVRDYAVAHNKVLFDFYDMDTHDPAGKYYADATDACTWCASWCSKHPADCGDLNVSGWPGECAHSHAFNCKMKAKAFWWMLARLGGWDGRPSLAPPASDATH